MTDSKSKDNEKLNQKDRSDYQNQLKELSGSIQMMADFLSADTEGLIICENCLDTAFDDDENLVSFTDDFGQYHIFCCRECMEEWKGSRT